MRRGRLGVWPGVGIFVLFKCQRLLLTLFPNMFLIYPVSLLREKLEKKKKNSYLTLVSGWAKGFDTECSFVPETSETGAEQPARAPQTLSLGEDRDTQERAHRTQPLEMLLLTAGELAVLPLQGEDGFRVGLWGWCPRPAGGATPRPELPRGPGRCAALRGAGRARPGLRGSAGEGGQHCGRRANLGRQRAGAPGRAEGESGLMWEVGRVPRFLGLGWKLTSLTSTYKRHGRNDPKSFLTDGRSRADKAPNPWGGSWGEALVGECLDWRLGSVFET